MTTLADIAGKARMRLRDFGRYFEVPFAPPAYTIRLPHPVVDGGTFQVFKPDGTVVPDGYTLDERNGIVKFADLTDWPDGMGCSGYHYEWFLDSDLEYYAGVTSTFHLYGREDAAVGDFSDQEAEVVAMGAAVNALWSLEAEFSSDIDVSTPEGMMIPANQRFRQVWELLQALTPVYKDAAAMLGVGLERMEQYNLRRIAYLTNRLVPMYMEREVYDRRWPRIVVSPPPQNLGAADEVVVAPGTMYEIPWPSGVARVDT